MQLVLKFKAEESNEYISFANERWILFSINQELYSVVNDANKKVFSAKTSIRNIACYDNTCAISDVAGYIYIVNLNTNSLSEFNANCNFDYPIILYENKVYFAKMIERGGTRNDISVMYSNGKIETLVSSIHLHSNLFYFDKEILFEHDTYNSVVSFMHINLENNQINNIQLPNILRKKFNCIGMLSCDFKNNLFAVSKWKRIFRKSNSIFIVNNNADIICDLKYNSKIDIYDYGWISNGKYFCVLLSNMIQIRDGHSFKLVDEYILSSDEFGYFCFRYIYSEDYFSVGTTKFNYIFKM